MPVVPFVAQPISPDVTSERVTSYPNTAISDALKSTGAALADNSFALLADVKKAQAIDTSSRAYYEDVQAMEDHQAKLKLTSPDGYAYDDAGKQVSNPDGTPQTLSQNFRNFMNDRYQANQQALPTEAAQQIYKARTLEYYNRQLLSVKTEEQAKRISSAAQAQSANMQNRGDSLITAPSTGKLYQSSNDLSWDVMAQVGKLYDLNSAKEKIQKLNQGLSEQMIKGAYNQVLQPIKLESPGFDRKNAIDTWRGVLAGTDPESIQRKKAGLPTVSDMLTPDKKAQLDEEFIRLYDVAKERDNGDFNRLFENHVAALGKGTADLAQGALITNLASKKLAAGDITTLQWADMQAKMQAAAVEGDALTSPSKYKVPEAQMMNLADQSGERAKQAAQTIIGGVSGTGDMGAVAGNAAKEKVTSVFTAALSKRREDFQAFESDPQYFDHADPGLVKMKNHLDFSNPTSFSKNQLVLQNYLQQTRADYKTAYGDDPQYWRIIGKTDSKSLAESLKNPLVPEATTLAGVNSLVQAYGKDFPELMDQMIKDGNLSQGWRIAAIAPQYLSQLDVIGSLKGRTQTLMDNYKTYAGPAGEQQLDKYLSADPTLQGFISSQEQFSPNSELQAMRTRALTEVIKTKAMKSVIESQGQITPDQAVSEASRALISNNVVRIQPGGSSWFGLSGPGGRQSTIDLPKRIGPYQIGPAQAQLIQEGLNSKMGVDATMKLSPVVPKGWPTTQEDPTGVKNFVDQVARTEHWRLSGDYKGFNLWWHDPNSGKDVQLTTQGKYGPVPVYVPASTLLDQGTATQPEKPSQPAVKIPKGIGIPHSSGIPKF